MKATWTFDSGAVSITWDDGLRCFYAAIWLYDNNPAHRDPRTGQRLITIESAIALGTSEYITREDLPPSLLGGSQPMGLSSWDKVIGLSSTATRKRNAFMDKNSNNVEPMKRSHGGARPGGGKPKGVKWPSTLAKAEAREKVRQFITEYLGEFLDAMAANVIGIRHLMRDPKTGKFERITGDAKHSVLRIITADGKF